MRRFGLAVAMLALASSCGRSKDRAEAEQSVRTYLTRMTDAYRAGDETLVDPLVGDRLGLNLTGLIGVKHDAGVVMDAKLLELSFTRVAPEGDGWVVETRERWYYADRQIGTGKQIGQDSTDEYAMRYRFIRKAGKLILEDLEFIGTPVVGRTSAPVPTDARDFHGLRGEQAAPEQGAAAGAAPRPAGMPPPGHPPVPAPRGAPPEPRR